jgi:histidine ammonia-lyase
VKPAPLALTGHDLTPETVAQVARRDRAVALAPAALERMAAARAVVERHLEQDRPVYGLTTGLGARVTHRLPREVLSEFSRLTILGRSNAVGPRLPREVVRALMLVRLNGLLAGGAGAAPAVAEAIAALLARGLTPVMPSIGSIGAGDLCVLAHLGLALIGEGEIEVEGRARPAAEALADAGLAPLTLGPKDGLAICNASAYSAGQAALALADARAAYETAQIAAALSMEGFRANLSPLDPRAAAARPAPGQAEAAAGLRRLLAGDALAEPGAARRLQDPISLRCVSQVHGSLGAALAFAGQALDPELNGAADNPLVLIEQDEIISTGNFHTPALALAFETLAQALARVAALSVSRACRLLTERLSGLPANLSPRGATRSGYAPPLKSAEALLQEIAQRAQPAPLELRWAADGVEDDLTNAPLAARKTAESADYLRLILAMELMVAAQAVELAEVERLGRGTAAALEVVRAVVPPLDEDRPHGPDAERLEREALATGRLRATVTEALGADAAS